MNKKITIILLLITSLSFCSVSFAETIHLKSGKAVEGKILEKTDKYIKIDFLGVPLTYFIDEIESIDGQVIGLAKEKNIPSQSQTYLKTEQVVEKSEYFLDPSGVFKIIPPKGFNKTTILPKGVSFSNLESDSTMDVQIMSPQAYGGVEKLKNKTFRLGTIRGMEFTLSKRLGSPAKVAGYREREVNGIPASEFTIKTVVNSYPFIFKSIIIDKNNNEFQIILGVRKNVLNSESVIFEESLATFQAL